MTESQIPNTRQLISLKNLYLDPNNFRLIHEPDQMNVPDEKIGDKDVASRTYRLILGDKNSQIQDLVESFKANGYLPVDQIQVRKFAEGKFVVVEGNRRVATLKFLQSEYELKSINLGKLDPGIFSRIPIVTYPDSDPVHHLTLMALKHISGNKKWGEWNQAKLLETLRVKHGLTEDQVCKSVGISKQELRRSLRALGLVEQYINSDYGDQFVESMFAIFREAVSLPTIKEWLGWNETSRKATHEINYELFFSFLSREEVKEDSESDYAGSYQKYHDAVITKRDDVRTLEKITQDANALAALRESRNLNEAYRSSKIIFEAKIEEAIKAVTNDVDTLALLALTSEQAPSLDSSLYKLRDIVDKARSNDLRGVEQSTLFYDRIDNHFSEITVNAYRSLKNLKIHKLSQINLLAGLNNCGKTSFLEAVYLLCRQNDFNGIMDILRRRGKIAEGRLPPRWLADQISETIAVSGVFDSKPCWIEIMPRVEDSSNFNRAQYLKSIEITSHFEDTQLDSLTRLYEGKHRESEAGSIKLLSRTVFSSPFFFNEPQHYTAAYHKSVQSKLLPQVLNFIKDKVVPSISDIRLVEDFQRFLVTDDNFDYSPDLTTYGEGLQRIFFTSLLFASAKDGVVLIDEFENAIHADIIEIFSPFVYELSKEFNVQVFLTSHSKECIDSFVKHIPIEKMQDFTFHALVREDNGAVAAREFAGEKFANLLRVGNVDLRRAR